MSTTAVASAPRVLAARTRGWRGSSGSTDWPSPPGSLGCQPLGTPSSSARASWGCCCWRCRPARSWRCRWRERSSGSRPARSVIGSTVVVALGLSFTGGRCRRPGRGSGRLRSVRARVRVGAVRRRHERQAATVERRLGRTIMPRFHAAWSVGTVVGAAVGAGAARTGLPIGVHLGAVALVVGGGTVAAARRFLPDARGRPAGAA